MADTASTLEGAVAAYWRFFESFNSADPATWTGALQFPHVRVSARGPARVIEKPETHKEGSNWERVKESGWDHSVGAEPEVLHISDDKVHIKGGWTRYTADNKPILTNHVTYIITRVGDRWGIQSRFGVDPGDQGLTGEHDNEALGVVRSVFKAMGKDRDEAAAGFNYPHYIVDAGHVETVDSADEMKKKLGDEAKLTDLRVLQSGPTGVNIAFNATIGGKQYEGVVLVTERDGHWGIQSRSSMPA